MVISNTTPNHGVPDLIVEILSLGNNQHDIVDKRNLYENFGVKEYWIVDPSTREAIVYSLQGKKFKLTSREIGKASSVLLDHIFTF